MKRVILTIAPIFMVFAATATAQFTDWSPPVNLGPVVNSPYADSCVAISKNGLSLFFSSNRQTGNTGSLNRDLYVSKRDSIDAEWGIPVPLTMLNTSDWDSCPALSLDEHRLYFTRRGSGSCGLEDSWVSRRHDRTDDFGWEPPVHLACENEGGVNSTARDLTPTFFEDEAGKVWMYYSTSRPGSGLDFEIYQSEMRDDGTFGPGTRVPELGSPFTDQGVTVRRDGLEVIIISNRGGTMDFWAATRASTADPWSSPEHVVSLGVPAMAQGRIALSFDGRRLYFTSSRTPTNGVQDLWVATRERLHGKP